MPENILGEHEKRRRDTVVDELSVMDDVRSQEAFDRIARMAKRMFEVDVVLITFIDSRRQWFESHLGTDKSETDLAEAFCA